MSDSGKKHKSKCAKFVFCSNSACRKQSAALRAALKEEIKHQGLKESILVQKKDCTGHCDKQPAVYLKKADKEFTEVKLKEVPSLVEAAKKLLR